VEIILIAAMSANRVLGSRQTIPWHVPGEQQRFKQTTWGYPLIMGRKTFDSIGHPLPGRRNIVLSRQADFRVAGCETVPTLEAALALCAGAEKVFVIGGEQLFTLALPLADTIILTTIAREVAGDTFFPEFESYFIKESEERVGGAEPYAVAVFRRQRPATAHPGQFT